MIYRSFKDLQLSALGLGCMRLPIIGGDNTKIDIPQTADMVAYALEHGVNYIDTAYPYHGKTSETVLGQVLEQYPRDSYYLATKFPGYDVTNFGYAQERFDEQIQKLRTDYFDFYLFHNVLENNIEQYLDNEKYHTYDILMNEKAKGRIHHLGFSAHGTLETMQRFYDAYGKDCDFVQIQLNWFDYEFQKAKEKVELIRSWGLPVWVMEPLRGGKLCNLSPEQEAEIKKLRPDETVPGMAFRFLQAIPEVTMVLSGMSSMEQLKANVKTFETSEPLNEDEMAKLLGIARDMLSTGMVPCTGCKYCTAHCPKELDIPTFMHFYNEKMINKDAFLPGRVLRAMDPEKHPSVCLKCGACMELCPQQINIPKILSDVVDLYAEVK